MKRSPESAYQAARYIIAGSIAAIVALGLITSDAQAAGRTIDVRDVLSYCPIIDDLRRYGRPIDLDPDTLRTGLYNQHDFDKVCIPDLSAAERSILISSGFAAPQRVRTYEPILRTKIADGVAVRCVARPRMTTVPFPMTTAARR
jgi:hypothetical protein